MANKKNPTPIKPKKPGWIRACFGLGPSHEARLEKGQLSGEEEVTRGGGKRRKLGLPEKKEAEATSFSEVKVAGILLLDDGSHEAHEPTGSEIQKPKPIVEEDGLKNAKRSEKDSLMGMSILITVLVIMLLCGRLCAILFTSIWFYCMPQLIKTNKKESDVDGFS